MTNLPLTAPDLEPKTGALADGLSYSLLIGKRIEPFAFENASSPVEVNEPVIRHGYPLQR
jgi:hypothetical protein